MYYFVAWRFCLPSSGAHILAIGQILIFVGGIVVLMLLAIGAAGFEDLDKERRKIGRLGKYVVRPDTL